MLVCLVLIVALLFLGLVIGFAVITNATIWLKAVFILFAILLLGLSLRLKGSENTSPSDQAADI